MPQAPCLCGITEHSFHVWQVYTPAQHSRLIFDITACALHSMSVLASQFLKMYSHAVVMPCTMHTQQLPFWLCLSVTGSQGKSVTTAFAALPFSQVSKGRSIPFVLWIVGKNRGGYGHLGDCAQLL